MRYWIVVVSKDHISRRVADEFMRGNHGKEGPLKRMVVDDWDIFYWPKMSYGGNDPLQVFTAIGQVADDKIYQHKMADDFIPYRRNIKYYHCKETPIAPLVDTLDFLPNKSSWGYPFRFGFFELKEHDFQLIKTQMLNK